jgi:hypothetical protein
MDEDQIRKVAERLGVSIEIVQKAQKLAHQAPIFRADYGAVDVNTPSTLFPHIQEAAHRIGTTKSGLLRAILYRYLQSTWEPDYWDRWMYKGEVHITDKQLWRTTITRVAEEVFKKRAVDQRMTRAKIVRSLFLGYIHGNFYTDLKLVNKAKFSSNLSDYVR